MYYVKYCSRGKRCGRRASILVLSAVFMVVMFAILALAVDIGYMTLAQTQLQNAADSAALAGVAYAPSYVYTPDEHGDTVEIVARRFATDQRVAGKDITDRSVSIQYGTWTTATRTFTSGLPGNAIRVTVERDVGHDGQIPLFFAAIFGNRGFNGSASAIAMTNPRDICFVVDLSGSMNDDTEPCWTTEQINNTFGGGIGDSLMQNVYNDFGYGAFPGTLQSVGQPLGAGVDTYNELVTKLKNNSSFTTFYRITNSDNNNSKKKIKAYRYLIDYQLAVIMPNALPTPQASDTASYNYWSQYLDYVIYPQPTGSTSSEEITDFGNPQTNSYPDSTTAAVQAFRNKLGYRTYVQFMMDFGRDSRPNGASQDTSLPYKTTVAPIVLNPLRRMHDEMTDAGTFSFPPREQPTHAARRATIAALNIVKERNLNVGEANQRDWVSIITFDKATNPNGVTILRHLNSPAGSGYDYDGAILDCTTMQAVSDIGASTATATALHEARNLLLSEGRAYTDKVVVLLTDGLPNLADSSFDLTLPHPLPQGWPSDTNSKQALTEILDMQTRKWRVFPVGIGMGCNYNFMDCAARAGGTADASGQSPRGSGDPSQYEQTVKNIFNNIINNPKARLVK